MQTMAEHSGTARLPGGGAGAKSPGGMLSSRRITRPGISQGESGAELESVKVTSEAIMPMSGTVVEVNKALEDTPERINSSPYDQGWLMRTTPACPDEPGLISASDMRPWSGPDSFPPGAFRRVSGPYPPASRTVRHTQPWPPESRVMIMSANYARHLD